MGPWHVYENPLLPDIFSILALAHAFFMSYYILKWLKTVSWKNQCKRHMIEFFNIAKDLNEDLKVLRIIKIVHT